MRRLAGELGLTLSAVYYYFPNRRALERALADEAHRRLIICVDRAAKWETGDWHVIVRICEAYLGYARRHTALYELVWAHARSYQDNLTAVEAKTPHVSAGFRSTVSAFDQRYINLMRKLVGDENVEQVMYGLWALSHGMFLLEKGHLLGERVHVDLSFMIETILQGLSQPRGPKRARTIAQAKRGALTTTSVGHIARRAPDTPDLP